ncbi:MAG: DUF3616 domain-containing protein, partial [Cyanobacteria bacterium Co-bin13]|nr:DUF3616 domain-containing protein [Cyanobacteria bacterium Co-bin13]
MPTTLNSLVPEGAIALSNPYSQTFDSLANTSTNIAWTDSQTLAGWYSTRPTYNSGTGSSNAGALYSFGAAGNGERALGSVASGSTGTIFYGARFFNDTSDTLSSLFISYVGEQWRNGGNTAQHQLDFAYQIGASGLTSGTWVDFDPLDFVGPIATSSAGALDGNANQVSLSSTLSGFSLAPGEEIWFRWVDIDNSGSDHGLAIDNFQLTTAVAPGITLLESGGSTDVNEEGETTDTYTLALRTTPTAPVQVAIAAPDNQTRLSLDGIGFASSVTLTLSDTTPQTITVKAVNDTATEGSPHTGVITHTVTSTDASYS